MESGRELAATSNHDLLGLRNRWNRICIVAQVPFEKEPKVFLKLPSIGYQELPISVGKPLWYFVEAHCRLPE